MSDLNDYLKFAQAAKAIGCSRRTLYRVVERMGGDIVTEAFGFQLIHKSRLPEIKAAYLPHGSKRQRLAAKSWGAAGGRQKGINAAKRTNA